jgi:hypothetical protein
MPWLQDSSERIHRRNWLYSSLMDPNQRVARFKVADLSCESNVRSDRRLHFLGKGLSDFLEEFHFTTAEIIAQHFNQYRPII